MNTKKTLLIQVVSIVLLALLSALVPREHLWLVFLLYLVVIMVITSRGIMKTAKRISKPKGPVLFEENNAVIAVSNDVELLNEMKKQSSVMLVSLTVPLIMLFLFIPLFWQYIYPGVRGVLESAIDHELLLSFLSYLVFYGLLALISLGFRRALSQFMKVEKHMLIPRKYAVYRDGLMADGRFIEFTEDLCYEVNSKRRFAAIHGRSLPFVIRLYTLEVSKLREALRGGRIIECAKPS